jgi:hypothetical protein
MAARSLQLNRRKILGEGKYSAIMSTCWACWVLHVACELLEKDEGTRNLSHKLRTASTSRFPIQLPSEMTTMNSVLSNTLSTYLVFANIAQSKDAITDDTKGNNETCREQEATQTHLDCQPMVKNASKKRAPTYNAEAETAERTSDSKMLRKKNSSDRLRQSSAAHENSEGPLARPYKKKKQFASAMVRLKSTGITKHHRRNNACISLDEVLQNPLVASLLLETIRQRQDLAGL